jgi:hypothetical protein
MAAVDERDHILQESELSTEVAWQGHGHHGWGRKVLLSASIAAVLAVCGLGVVAHHNMRQVPARDVGAQRAFLNEVVISAKSAQSRESEQSAKHADSTKAEDLAKKVSSEDALKSAEHLAEQAWRFSGRADNLTKDAKTMETKVEKMRQTANGIKEQAAKERHDATSDRSHAKELRRKAEALRKAAESLMSKASDLDKDAQTKSTAAGKQDKSADQLAEHASSVEKHAKKVKKKAVDVEAKSLKAIAAQRMCIRLPGVRVRGVNLQTFPEILGDHKITDEWQCTDWCLKHEECKQAVFIWETKTCELFGEATDEPLAFKDRWPFYNSSYCDVNEKKEDMLKMLHKVYEAKPWVPPPHNCSWSGGSCMETKCCADVCKATWDFSECKYYTCFKKDENFAGCVTGGPPGGWDGTRLGGHPNGEIGPAPKGKLIQGTKLYCFSVIMWSTPPKEAWMSSEGELANHWKEQKKNIMQCDDYNFFDGLEGGSVHNIQSFISAWKKVKEDGRWKRNDWTIKVDPDAVFFPEHLRQKIRWNYRTPQGSAVYLRNTFYKFKFLGALEAMTREAMELYFERGWECEAHLGQEGGEDYWLEQCLEGLGIDFQTDTALVHDKYAQDENCGDPYSVAHHFFKKISDWDGCWDLANKAWNDAHQQ